MYTVFYQAGPNSFFMSRTDFPLLEQAQGFVDSTLFAISGFTFIFMLRDGKELIKGKPQKYTQEYYSASMQFAVVIPMNELGYFVNN